jgi:hypothetical protein
MTPEALRAQADLLLRGLVPGAAGCWPRACVWLLRLALEQGLDRHWAAVLPEAADCPMRPQLLLLSRYIGPDAAQRARQAWSDLSRAVHHNPYETAPTATELRRWHDQVTTILTDLTCPPITHRGGPSTTQ